MSDLEGVLYRTNEDTKNYKILRVSSKERISGTPYSFNCNFGNSLELTRIKEVQLLSFSTINQFYNVSAARNNNRFSITHSVDGVISVIVADGQYTINQLYQILTNLINASLSVDTIQISQVQNSLETSLTISDPLNTIFVGVSPTNTLGETLGFTSPTFLAPSITSDSVPNLIGETFIHIHSNQIARGSTLLSVPGMNGSSVNGAFSIPITQSFGSAITTEIPQKIVFGVDDLTQNLSEINITLRGNRGRLLSEMKDNFETVIVFKVFY